LSPAARRPQGAASVLGVLFSSGLSCLLPAVLLGGFALASHAQALPPGVRLGMAADQLPASVAGLARVPRPARLSGGLVGAWRGDAVEVAGQRFEPTFFIAEGQLRRIEYAALTPEAPARGAAAFAALLDWGRGLWGAERLARDAGATQTSEIASWAADGDLDVVLQRAESARHASVRLIYRLRQLKDASEL